MPTKTQINCPPIDMEKCGQLTVPSAGDDPILLMELYANQYKACKMRQQGLVKCINRFNKR